MFIGQLALAAGQVVHGVLQCALRSYAERVGCAAVAGCFEKAFAVIEPAQGGLFEVVHYESTGLADPKHLQ